MKLPRGLSGNEVARLQPHPAMRDSGAQWLGKVPAHWEVRRLRNVAGILFSNVDKHSKDDESPVRLCNYLDVYHNDRIRSDMYFMKATAAADEIERYRLVIGDVLITKDSESWNDIGVPALVESTDYDLICGYHLALLRPVRDEITGEYLYRALTCQGVADQLYVRANGVTRFGLSQTAIKSVWLPVPSFPEQAAIIRFLDHADRRIQRYIRAKEKLIALLEEQKQAIVHQAVTGRIDVRTGRPYPAYKPSGVDWLGDVPAHWYIMPLKKVTLTRCDGPFGSGLKSSHYADRGVRVIRLQNIGHGEFNNTDSAYISFSHYATLGDHSVEAKDVLIAGLGDPNHPAGRACVAPVCIEPAMVKADCFRFRLNGDVVDSKFISLQLTATANAASAILSTGATRQRINLHSTSARLMALPSLSEQVTVVDFVDKAISEVNSSVARSQRQIGLLREYRTRLIADVVTGKVDVRSTAAGLPELEPITDGGRLDAIQDEADFPIAEGSIAQEAS